MDTLETTVKFVARNFDELVFATKALIALKLGSMIFPAITGAITLMNVALVASTGAMTKFNTASLRNPLFLIGGGAILAITAIVQMMKEANAELTKMQDNFVALNTKQIEKAREELKNLQNLLEIQKGQVKLIFDNEVERADMLNQIALTEAKILNLTQNVGLAIYSNNSFAEHAAEIARKEADEAERKKNALTDEQKLRIKQLEVMNRLILAQETEAMLLTKTEAELILHNLLKMSQ